MPVPKIRVYRDDNSHSDRVIVHLTVRNQVYRCPIALSGLINEQYTAAMIHDLIFKHARCLHAKLIHQNEWTARLVYATKNVPLHCSIFGRSCAIELLALTPRCLSGRYRWRTTTVIESEGQFLISYQNLYTFLSLFDEQGLTDKAMKRIKHAVTQDIRQREAARKIPRIELPLFMSQLPNEQPSARTTTTDLSPPTSCLCSIH